MLVDPDDLVLFRIMLLDTGLSLNTYTQRQSAVFCSQIKVISFILHVIFPSRHFTHFLSSSLWSKDWDAFHFAFIKHSKTKHMQTISPFRLKFSKMRYIFENFRGISWMIHTCLIWSLTERKTSAFSVKNPPLNPRSTKGKKTLISANCSQQIVLLLKRSLLINDTAAGRHHYCRQETVNVLQTFKARH